MRAPLRSALALLLLLFVSASASAQSLTPAQRTTLKAAIVADNPANVLYVAGDLSGLAAYYNTTASPNFYVYRTAVPVQDINDNVTWANFTPADAPDSTQLWLNRATAAQGKQFNLQTLLLSAGGFLNATKANVRQALTDALTNLPTGAGGSLVSGGWGTVRDNALARRGSRLEKLFATTTVQQDGSTAAKAATMTVEGPIVYTEFIGL